MMTTLEFKRAEVAERGMAPAAVVESFDVLEHRATGLDPGLPPAGVNQFDFERSEETLRHRVVPAVAAAAHAAPDPVQRQQLLVVVAGVLAATIRMMQQPWCRLALSERGPQCLQREAALEPLAQRPADHPAREQIQD